MCCACGGGSTGTNDDSNTPISGDEGKCISDARTPQSCLDEYIHDFTFAPRNCFLNESSFTRVINGQRYGYILFYGGCADRSVDVWFDRTDAIWDRILIASRANQLSREDGRITFNLKTGGADRVGFRLPAD